MVGGEDRNFGDAVTDGAAVLEPPGPLRTSSYEPLPTNSIGPADPEHAPPGDTTAEPEPENIVSLVIIY